MSGRPVPWASWDEWQALRDDLWSANPQRQEAGLQQICAWRLRGKLPLGVDATAHLMDVRRADTEWQRAVALAAAVGDPVADAAVVAGELPLRLRYSLPLIRLVNGISDSQQRGRVASSVAVLADTAGLPRALVDVRHEATHNELPSLPLLRAAADSALAWLWDNYWDGQGRALAAASERIGLLLGCLTSSWREATAAGLSGSVGALAAEAAAAAAADEDDDEGDGDADAAAGGCGGYSSSAGQRARRQAMSEIRSLVPPAFTHELLHPILNCQVLLPPELPLTSPSSYSVSYSSATSRAAAAGTVAGACSASASAAQQQQRELVDARAWRSTMKQLVRWYPRLRPLLLQAALQRLVAVARPAAAPQPPPPSAAAAHFEDAAPEQQQQRARVLLTWVMRLLPTAVLPPQSAAAVQGARLGSPSRKQGRVFGAAAGGGGGKGASKSRTTTAAAAAGAAPDGDEDGGGGGADALLNGPLPLLQLQELLSIAMAAAAPGSAVPAGGAGGAAATAGAAAPRQSPAALQGGAAALHPALEEVVAALRRAIAQAGSGSGRGGTKRPRVAAAPAGDQSYQPCADGRGHIGPADGAGRLRAGRSDGDDGDGSGADFTAARGCDADVLKLRHTPGKLEGLGPRPGPGDQPGRGPRRPRWERCSEWSRCAIGCLPCPLNPNGRLPPLAAPPPPAAQPQAQQQLLPGEPAVLGLSAAVPAPGGGGLAGEAGQERHQDEDGGGGAEGGEGEEEYYAEPSEEPDYGGPQEEEARGGKRGDGGMDGLEGAAEAAMEGQEGDQTAGEGGSQAAGEASLFATLLQQQEGASGAVGFLL